MLERYRFRALVSHISRKTSEMWGTRPFFKERRVEFGEPNKLHRKSGVGHPDFVGYKHPRASLEREDYSRSIVALSGTPLKYFASASLNTLFSGWEASAKRVTEE
jgi:hypothetical protein